MGIAGTARLGKWSKHLLYIDRGLLVLNKPHGLTCQLEVPRTASELNKTDFGTLLNELTEHFELPNLPYPIHRLDKGTTGAFVLARSASTARQLSQQFCQKEVHKSYIALVRGGAKSFEQTTGEIRVPICYNDGWATIQPKTGKYAATDWECIASSPIVPLSLMRLNLLTGRKHQLRIHLAHCLKTPILGDKFYSRKAPKAITDVIDVPEDRIFLHSSEVSFLKFRKTGSSKEFRLRIRAPLPDDFLNVCREAQIPISDNDVRGGLFVDDEVVELGSVPDVGGRWIAQMS